MPLSETEISIVCDTLSDLDDGARLDILITLGNLFASRDCALTKTQLQIYDEVILRLSLKADPSVRAVLAQRLCHLHDGPVRTMRAFAKDRAPEIALPVLRYSPLLSEADLMAVAGEHDAGRRLAIAEERPLPESVTSLLLATADLTLLRALSGNRRARISERGFQRLLNAAKSDFGITGNLLRRRDMPPSCSLALAKQYRDQLRIATGGKHPAAPRPAPQSSLPSFAGRPQAGLEIAVTAPLPVANELALAEVRVEAMMRKGALYHEDIAWCLGQKRQTDALVIIAKLSHQPSEFVARSFADEDFDLQLAIMRLAELSWDHAEQVLRRRAGSGTLPALEHKYRRLSLEQAEKTVRRARFLARVTVFRSNKTNGSGETRGML